MPLNDIHRRAAPSASTDRPLTLGIAWRFFAPLVLMTELNMISKSVIHAFLARGATPSATLAGFNTAFAFYYTLVSATEITTLLTISYLDNRRCLARIVVFLLMILALPVLIAVVVAFSSAGDRLFGGVFGLSDLAVREARISVAIFALSAPVLIARGVAFGLLMVSRRTLFITGSTLVRLVSLALLLTVLPMFFAGASVGAGALVACMYVETVFAWSFAWREFARLPRAGDPPPRFGALWRFSWPLILNMLSEMGVIFVINLFLGRLARPDVALAAFGVVHGLVGFVFSPMRNLVQTGQTLARSVADRWVLLTFTAQLVVIFAILSVVLFSTPLVHVVLEKIMGLSPELARYSEPAMRAAFAMSLFWATAALGRGLLAGQRSTLMLAVTGGLRLIAATAAGALGLLVEGLNGAVLGLAAWIFAYMVEALVLALRLRRGPGTAHRSDRGAAATRAPRGQ